MATITNLCKGRTIYVKDRTTLYWEMVRNGYLSPNNAVWSDYIPAKCGSDAFETWAMNVFNFEGGYVNHPNDPGGPTNKGVTLETWQGLAPTLFNIPGTLETLKNITEGQAIRIADYYWKASGAPLLDYEAFQIMTAEMNWGTATKAIPLQNALNALGVKVSVDGVVGPKTAKAVNDFKDSYSLWFKWMQLLEEYWRGIPKQDSTEAVFLAGWLRRTYETRAYAIELYPLKKKSWLKDWRFQIGIPIVASVGFGLLFFGKQKR